jgi:hypothetical protein
MFMSISFRGKLGVAPSSTFRKSALVILILFVAFISVSVAQEDRAEIIPHRNLPVGNVKPTGKEPRALGVLQLTGNKATLVPVAILINGRFYDASAYKADPIPMALESGTVYEVEQAGDSQGFFTVSGALHSNSAASAHPWVGSGTYLPPGAAVAKNTRKAENVPVGLNDNGDEPPRLTRKSSTSESNSSPTGAAGSQGQETSKSPGTSTTDKGADSPSQQQTASAPTTGPAATPASSASATPSSSSQSSPAGGADENYYRPTLRRGKPTTAPPADNDESVAKKTTKAEPGAPVAGASAAAVKALAAISDAAGPDPQSYKFFWKTGEEEERRNQMIALAEGDVRAYATALVDNQIPARSASSKTTAAKEKLGKKERPVLENVQFHGFDVWLNNQPVMILSAEAHFPDAANMPTNMPQSYNVTVVARTDIYGNLQKLFTAVSDKFHLDVAPRLELIDVVDADGDGRGELLFRETTDAGNGYLIYRATADRLWKMFDSLSAE